MHEIIDIDIEKTIPSKMAILRAQGIPDHAHPGQKILDMIQSVLETYRNLARPVGIVKDISMQRFTSVYMGEGENDPETPLEDIYKFSDSLALFAVTIGEDICSEIRRLFETNDFAQASILDSTASEGTELAAIFAERVQADYLKGAMNTKPGIAVSRFSPGYCGWHISGQKKLFEFLQPDKIGITLNDSCLMQPIKSISGVFVAGNEKIFEISDSYPFCSDCASHSCQEIALTYLEGD